jgi:peptidyl-prolyl cis-trans isomerase B (cyclophilin B)
VIDKFMIQGGGLGPDMQQKSPTRPAVKNEARADVPNKRGTLAMARTTAVDSARSQFFINQADNKFLDHRGERDAEFGYCVFGKVLEGLDVVDAIAKVQTESRAGIKDVPVEAVTIKRIRRVTP